MTQKRFSALPGFNLTMGFTVLYLSGLVLIPFAALIIRASEITWADFWRLATSDRALASYRLTIGASFIAAVANAVFGTLLAWVLVRYEFPGRRWIDAIVDFPFALPTAVAGLTLADLFAPTGWLGRFLVPLGIEGAYSRLGVVIALIFVGLPFVVRTLQPVLQKSRTRSGRGGGDSGRRTIAHFCSRDCSIAGSIRYNGLCPGFRTGHWRIRFDYIYFRQQAV